MLLIGIGNVTDYGTNFAFVQHVLAMDTTNFGSAQETALDPDVMWRAINSPALQTAAYVAIIIWECATAAVLLVATGQWLRALRSNSFDTPRRWSSIGLTMIVIVFMGGFIAIGGEWFQMWRSTEWNGIDAAFRNAVLALFGLVMVHLPSSAWGSAVAPASAETTVRDWDYRSTRSFEEGDDVIVPISDSAAVGMKLAEYGPLQPPVGTPLDGPMTTSGQVFWQSEDESIVTGVWECSAGRLRADFGNDGEMVHVVKGTIQAVGDDGEERTIGPGESATFPPYWKGIWVLENPMRKLYCVFKFEK